jgi:hypothetical protein
MKFLLPFLSFGLASANLPIFGAKISAPEQFDSIKVDSPLGAKIMEQARKLEENAVDFTWVANFSIKFQGCHHVTQWNENANQDEDVKIQTKRLIRFRLCPTDSCSSSSSSGCSSSYGDYVLDMNTFLTSYYQAVDEYNQYKCAYIATYECSCSDDDGKGDDFNMETCISDCYTANGVSDICEGQQNNNNNNNNHDAQNFNLANYVGCQNARFQNNNRILAEENQYFIGPYCAAQGGAIFLGLFTDDTCTSFADQYGGTQTYSSLTGGVALPYSSQSVITMDCVSCKEPADNNVEGNDAEDTDEVNEMCERIYDYAGKCESALKSTGYVSEANENACNYIAGIKVLRKDGIITQVGSKANKTASIFIGIFVVAFVLLAAYVYYLKTKLDRASINLHE